MNAEEMKERHDSSIVSIAYEITLDLDRSLSNSYNQLMQKGYVKLWACRFNVYKYSKNDIPDIVEKVKQHYKNDWEVTYYAKTWRNMAHFIFKDKKKIEKKKNKIEIEQRIENRKVNRFKLMDIGE